LNTRNASMQSNKINWGILGTGLIADIFAEGLRNSNTGTLVAVGSRSAESAERFAARLGVPKAYHSYAEVLSDPDVHIVYIALPNHLHCEWTINCAEKGKHILCEKPAATNHGEIMTMIESVRRHGVFFMEAFMYRCHPQTAKLVSLIRDGAVGTVRFIRTTFTYDMGYDFKNIRLQNSLAGGSIMDIGCYCTSMARLLAGAAIGRESAEPEEVKGLAHLGSASRVDEWAIAQIRFPDDILATLTCANQIEVEPTLEIWGTEGFLRATNPWMPGNRGSDEEIILSRKSENPTAIAIPTPNRLYALEADVVADHLSQGQAPQMTWAESVGNMKTLDAWRREVNLVFEREKIEALTVPFTGRPLDVAPDHRMGYSTVDGVTIPVSRIVLGSMSIDSNRLAYSVALLDYFFERGGNCIDTAWIYRTGNSEKGVATWIERRQIREKIVLIGKGGAPIQNCTPTMVTAQLFESLERLRTDYIDIYLMHRDNPELPVGEFVECLNEHWRAGRIRSFGGSNWTIARLEQANAYAKAHGLRGFTASSPNFSLAVWNEPTWTDCVSASDQASREWYDRQGMPLFAWSSQAAGFFSGRYREDEADKPGTSDIARVWFNKANFERMERARELAQKKVATPNQVALAYVLCQSPNFFALVGPESIEELRQSIEALKLELTPSERRWLNLES
jgi:predicted dehydrogenase/aryl-alcohol dehydrogenase-like predicted oxidoreductase